MAREKNGADYVIVHRRGQEVPVKKMALNQSRLSVLSGVKWLRTIEDELVTCGFQHLSQLKREELADAVFICALRSRTPVVSVISKIKTTEAFDERHFFKRVKGNIFDFVHTDLQDFAKRLFHKKAGGGTPNAAMGKGELLLLLLGQKTTKPTTGDVLYQTGRRNISIELKANSGKLGLGNCRVAHSAVVSYCTKHGIDLPISKHGTHAKGQFRFTPFDDTDRKAIANEHLGAVLSVWWEAISGKKLHAPTWRKIRKEFLSKVATQTIGPERHLLVISKEGHFRFFRDPNAFVKFYDHDKTTFEYRAHHNIPFSVYLNLPYVPSFDGTQRGTDHG